jgi:hypothetical protein
MVKAERVGIPHIRLEPGANEIVNPMPLKPSIFIFFCVFFLLSSMAGLYIFNLSST